MGRIREQVTNKKEWWCHNGAEVDKACLLMVEFT